VCAAPIDEARAAADNSGTTEGPFLASLQPISRGLVRTRANLQVRILLHLFFNNRPRFGII
jgi:hypothetical protein